MYPVTPTNWVSTVHLLLLFQRQMFRYIFKTFFFLTRWIQQTYQRTITLSTLYQQACLVEDILDVLILNLF